MTSFLRRSASDIPRWELAHLACFAHPEASTLRNAEWLGESGPILESRGSIWMSASADGWIATPPAWAMPLPLPSPSRCTAVAPYVWRRLDPVCLCLVLPILYI